MKLLISFLIAFSTIAAQADNLNNRQRRLSTVYLSQTDIGQNLLQQNSLRHVYFDKYTFGDIQPQLTAIYNFQTNEHKQINTFKINGLLLGASPIYLSWTLAYTLKQYEMHEDAVAYGFNPKINFLEKQALAFVTAAEHWVQMGSPNNEDFIEPITDQPNDIRNHIDASAKEFDTAYRSGKFDFIKQVKQRFYKLNPNGKTASELLSSGKLNKNQKIYINQILEELESKF